MHMDLMAAKLVSLVFGTWNTGNSLPPWVYLCLTLSLYCLCFYPICIYAYLPLKNIFTLRRNRLVAFSLPALPFCPACLSLFCSLSLLFLSEVFMCLTHSHNTIDTRYYFHLEWRPKSLDSFFQA